jgi:hypothetical protein
MLKIIIVTYFITISNFIFSQKIILNEGFENEYKINTHTTDLKVFGIDTYLPKQKYAIDLVSNSMKEPYGRYYMELSCNDSTNKNLFVSMMAYDNEIYNLRRFLIIKLDEPLSYEKKYRITFKSKLSPYSSFVVDSLGFAFFSSEKDVFDFFKSGFSENNNETNVSVKNIDCCFWKTFSGIKKGISSGQYIMIGNFRFNNQVKLKTKKKFNKQKIRQNSVFFIDDVFINEL